MVIGTTGVPSRKLLNLVRPKQQSITGKNPGCRMERYEYPEELADGAKTSALSFSWQNP